MRVSCYYKCPYSFGYKRAEGSLFVQPVQSVLGGVSTRHSKSVRFSTGNAPNKDSNVKIDPALTAKMARDEC
jgi:hypothetical protein